MEKVSLTGAQETMLATLWGRAQDSRSADPILGDHTAVEVVADLDYDFRKTGMSPAMAAAVAIRGKLLDGWTREFLAAHPSSTVLHLACGMDTRVHRLAPDAGVRWIDVDQPDVVDLRTRLLPAPDGDYTLMATSVTADGWIEDLPADRPTAVVFEGLSMYLRPDDGKRLIQRLTGHFGHGVIMFDSLNRLGLLLQHVIPAIRNARATLHWSIDDPREPEAWHPGLHLSDALRTTSLPDVAKLPFPERVGMRFADHVPYLRDVGRVLRYTF